MKARFLKITSLALACCMSVALLSSCGGNTVSNTPGSSASPPSSGSSSPATETKLIPGDGVLDIGNAIGLDTLTPFRANTARDQPFFKQLFEALAVPDANKELQPWVAKSWKTEDNGFTYDIEIWDTVSDSAGNHITAADIVWFIEKSMEVALKPAFAKVEHVEQTGDYTLRIKFSSNVVGNMERILEDTFVISQAAFEASSDKFGTGAVTTSAYKVTSFTASSVIAFEKRADYWQDINLIPECVRPMVDKVTYHCIPEASQMGIALETGTIDIAWQMNPATGVAFIDNSRFTADLTEGPQGYQLFFSGADSSAVANNVKLRQAICYSIDPQGLITGFCSGYGDPMYDVCPPGMIGFVDSWKNDSYYGYDPAKAKALLAESGYKGEELSLLAVNSAQRLVEILQNYMVAIGVNVKLNLVDMALYTATRLDGTKYDMTINTIGGTFMSDHWAIRYDPAAYATGDATSRHDNVLAALLYKTWTPDGYTAENITKVHEYIRDSAIAYGLVNPKTFTVWNNNLDIQTKVYGFSGAISPTACTFGNI